MKDIYKRKVNMSIKRLLVMAIVCVFALGALVSCENDDAEQEVSTESVLSKAGTVQLYHATDTEVVPDDDRYQLVQPDNLSAALEEVIENMTLSNGLTIDRFSVDENRNISLIINVEDKTSEETLLLNQAAIVKSIKGLETGSVVITLQDATGKIIETGTYTDASFYYYDE